MNDGSCWIPGSWDLPMSYNSIVVTLSSLKSFFFNGLKKELCFSDNAWSIRPRNPIRATVTCVCHKQIVKTATVQAEPASLAASVRRWFPGATLASAYEAGFSAFVLHRALTTAGITNIVVHPASIAVAANDKVKTDRRDSKKLAVDLADGRLRGIYIPTEEEELARLLPRTRAQMVEHRATIARQIKATLHQFGLIAPPSRRMLSHRYVREIESWTLPPELRASLKLLAEQWRFVTRQLVEMRRLLREQAAAQAELEKVYRSVPGIGEVVARTLATALGDMTRFAHERALFSYTGLTPSEYSSGNAVRRGHKYLSKSNLVF